MRAILSGLEGRDPAPALGLVSNKPSMDGRRRILVAMRGDEPDRIPCALSFYHVSMEDIAPLGAPELEHVDVQFIRFPISPEERELSKRTRIFPADTRLGSASQIATYHRWRYAPENPGRRNPLAKATTLKELQDFPFPQLNRIYDPLEVQVQIQHIHADGRAAGGNLPHLGGELFEAAWRLRGLENFLLDLIRRPEMAHFLLDRLTDLACRNAAALGRSGVDLLSLDDDIGMPGTMIISPDLWRQFFKPRFKSIIQAARQENPELLVLFHSDGFFTPIIPDLIEIGVQAINPLQPDHMDAGAIRAAFGSKLVLWGTVGHHTTFSMGNPESIRAEVAERIRSLGREGLILCPAYDIDEPDVPWKNVAAFLTAVRDFG
jgi:uroporphyrinogen decarboxylase